jgi:glycosyltransferase involved in cell wall biosynthesis
MVTNQKYRVLFFSPFFFPEQISTGKYNTKLAEALVVNGCDVQVIASHPLYPYWIPQQNYSTLEGMTIHRAGSNIRYPKYNLLRRFVLEVWFACHATVTSIRTGKKFDCSISIFPPSLFFLFIMIILPRQIKRIGIVHDLQGVYISRSSNLIGRLVNFAIHCVEQIGFQGCDKLIFLSKTMAKEAILEYGLDERKCVVCYPFVTIAEEGKTIGSELRHVFTGDKIHVVYSGALGEKQNSNKLFLFMDKLAGQNELISCHIFSGGPMFEMLKMSTGPDSQVQFHDLVPVELLSELYARSDIQVIPQIDESSEGSLPSKFPNLLAAGVPVFSICDPSSEFGKLVIASGIGFVSNGWDTDKLIQDILVFIEEVEGKSHQLRKQIVSEFIKDNFGVEQVVKEIIGETPAECSVHKPRGYRPPAQQ